MDVKVVVEVIAIVVVEIIALNTFYLRLYGVRSSSRSNSSSIGSSIS